MINKFIAMLFAAIGIVSCAVYNSQPDTVRKSRSLNKYSSAEDPWKSSLFGYEKFKLIDQFSDAHSLYDYSDKNALYLVSVSKTCINGREEDFLSSLPKEAGSATLLVTSAKSDSYSDYQDFNTRTLFDHWQFLSKAYELQKTGDYVKINPQSGEVDQKGTTSFVGHSSECTNQFLDAKNLDFSKDVLKYFFRSCVKCHMRYKGVDYFDSMSSIENWAKMSLTTMQIFRMPPGGTDNDILNLKYHDNFKNLTNIYLWLENGAKYTAKDEKNLKIARRKHRANIEKKYFRKIPDFVFEMKTKDEVPESGAAYYTRSELGGPFPEDVYLDAARFSHNLNVLHHSNIRIVTKEMKAEALKSKTKRAAKMFIVDPNEVSMPIKIYADGKFIGGQRIAENFSFSISRRKGLIRYLPPNAIFAPKGSFMEIENHYQPSGKKEFSTSRVELFKYKGEIPPRQINRYFIRANPFIIPKNKKDFLVESYIPVTEDITLLEFKPHMHYRGKSVKLFLLKDHDRKKLLFSVPFYQLKFETPMLLREPLFIPKGSMLYLIVKYDNSKQNISNPDPNISIKLGDSTYENEMHSMRISFIEGSQ